MELLKVLMPLLTATISLAMTWFVGSQIAAAWALRQKRRESVHAAVSTFQRLYGRWFSLAKIWILHKSMLPEADSSQPSQVSWLLLRDIIDLEGEFEAFWLKLSAQYELAPSTIDAMERFREGFQVLRRAAVQGDSLNWFGTNGIEYRAFKSLAAKIVAALGREQDIADKTPIPMAAVGTFHRVTSNEHQNDWFALGDAVQQPTILGSSPR